MNGEKSGKTVKRKRPVPPGLTKQEEKVLKKVTRRAHRLDQCLNICGIKVGWGAVIGIVPGSVITILPVYDKSPHSPLTDRGIGLVIFLMLSWP